MKTQSHCKLGIPCALDSARPDGADTKRGSSAARGADSEGSPARTPDAALLRRLRQHRLQRSKATGNPDGAGHAATLKSDAGKVVKQIEGVEQVDNQIEVLPLLAHGRSTALGALSSHLRLPGAGALRHAGHQADPDHRERTAM